MIEEVGQSDPAADPVSALPDTLETMPAGLALSGLLGSIDRRTLAAADLLRLARARERLIAAQQAELLADLHRVARAVPEQGAQPGRRDTPGRYPWAEVEAAFALTWTTRRAGAEFELADELIGRLPAVYEALADGEIDRARAVVFRNVLTGIDDELAGRIVASLIGRAARLTTSQLAAKLRRLVLAADPHAATRRARTEVANRRVSAFLHDNQLASITGSELAPHRVAAAMERLTATARAAKSAGDPRKIDQLRADVLLDLLVGEGVATGGPITDGGLDPDEQPAVRSGAVVPADLDPDRECVNQLQLAEIDPPPAHPPAPTRPGRPSGLPGPRRGVVDLQVPLTTLVGLANLPGDLDGWGPVIADIARQVVAEHPDSQWRFSVYSEFDELISHGITQARPDPSRRRPPAVDAAFIRARDRTCRAPGCRQPAKYCDLDHTIDWAKSSDSRRCNLACLCRQHHLFKHQTGAELIQVGPGGLGWVTATGMRYVTHPDPYPSELEPVELV